MSMTREEFVSAYCEYSGTPWTELVKHLVAVPCGCGEEGCQGWQMKSIEAHILPSPPPPSLKEKIAEATAAELARDRAELAEAKIELARDKVELAEAETAAEAEAAAEKLQAMEREIGRRILLAEPPPVSPRIKWFKVEYELTEEGERAAKLRLAENPEFKVLMHDSALASLSSLDEVLRGE